MSTSAQEEVDDDDFDDTIGMFEAAYDYFDDNPQNFEELLGDAKKPLYPNCKNFTKISALLKLYNLKAKFGWSDRSFTELLALVRDMLPSPNEIPNSMYQAKKTLCILGMKYEKIHACRKDCCLFRKELSDEDECPICGTSRWKLRKDSKEAMKNVPAKVMWYFSPIPRFERMFRRNDIDVYLAPLVDDLKKLWNDGVECFDAYQERCFTLKAILLWTINDFPAYGNLCGCTVKGYHACPICGEKTSSIYLPKGRKMAYLGHRKFLPRNHPYRKQKKAFNGKPELGFAPEPLSGVEILAKANGLQYSFGKKGKKEGKKEKNDGDLSYSYWKNKSIFFELEYWKHLHVRHCLDVMHIEKNVCSNLICTLLDIPGKSKDGLQARLDLVELNIR
ncbi:uncharacterized protein LOC111022513 [Momordica charantia]|uniref:Uncharacterized protein LOC111022513 n=1 Tax=Momordica charantia TaxID=3673 RepID=A0A6J1DQ29_MOMCH|nr:uncharacterized protein LOC111022513 [Momordica charantia]